MNRISSGRADWLATSDKFLHQVAENHQRRLGARRERLVVHHPPDRLPQAQSVLPRELLDLLHRGTADASRRRVDDAQQADRIGVRRRQLQVRYRVLDFRPLVETETAHHVVLAPVPPQRLFDLPGLRFVRYRTAT